MVENKGNRRRAPASTGGPTSTARSMSTQCRCHAPKVRTGCDDDGTAIPGRPPASATNIAWLEVAAATYETTGVSLEGLEFGGSYSPV